MGYTHYWTPKKATPGKWNELVSVSRQLKANLPRYSETAGGYYGEDAGRSKRVIKIRGGMGTGKSSFNKQMIWFNGDEKRGLDHETFMISPNKTEWHFCKTARKPYDLLVCAVLIACVDVLDYDVSSDGDFNDWKPAIKFYLDTIYDVDKEFLTGSTLKSILPKFLFEEQGGSEYIEPYNLVDEIREMFGYKKIGNSKMTIKHPETADNKISFLGGIITLKY